MNNKIVEYMLDFGYIKNDINLIFNTYGVKELKQDTLFINIKIIVNYFLSIGYSKPNIIKMTKSCPNILGLSMENIKDKIQNMIDLGYTKNDIIKMTTVLPNIYSFSIENINNKIKDMIDLGYTKNDIIKMTKNIPAIYCYSIENIKQKIQDMIDLGYKRSDVIKMTKVAPGIYGLNIENIKQKINDLIALGYTKEKVLKMTSSLPTLYGLSIKNIKQKIVFYKMIGINEMFINDSKQLMQSLELSYARYHFYKSIGIEINKNNYRKLFVNQKAFIKTYGITNKELIEMYNYDRYKRIKKGV